MKLVKTSRTLGLVALAAIASPCAVADDSGWYAGANVGHALCEFHLRNQR